MRPQGVVCVLALCLVTTNAVLFDNRRVPDVRVVQVARLAGFEGGDLPHKYSRHPNVDYNWQRIAGANALPGDLTSFKAYADEYEDPPALSTSKSGGFEMEMLVCKARTRDPDGRGVYTYILRPGSLGPCSEIGNGWQGEFNFWVADSRKRNTQEIFFATCNRRVSQGSSIYTRVSTERIDCGTNRLLNHGSFFAEVGPMACAPIQNPPHAYRVDTQHSGGITRTILLRCQSGYTMQGPSTLNCVDGNWDSDLPTCGEISCLEPPSVRNGQPSHRGPYPFMTEISYVCSEGYELYPPSETIQCRENGEWTQGLAQCRPIDCGFPGNIENGDVSPGPYTFGSTVDFSCDSGYVLHGSNRATCRANGQWTDITPTCRQIRCGNLLHPEHGTLLITDYSAGSDVIVRCHSGYRLVGSATLRCEQDGETAHWTGETPRCERITCEPPEAPENGTVLGTDFQYDAQVSYTCSMGFLLRGSDRAQCTEEGWDVEPPICQVLRCRDPGTPEGAEREVLGEPFVFGTVVQYSCGEGAIMEGSQTLMCTEEGNWNEEPPTCDPVHCTPLDPPEFGASDVDHFQTGGVIRFMCSPGYEIDGPQSAECQFDGTWSHPVPECRPCPIGTYKEGANNARCERCPANSNTTTMASFSYRHCMCLPGTSGPLGGPCDAITCDALSAPEGGRMTPCGNNNLDECHFDCEPGFFLQGSRVRKCTLSGWTGNPPICSECPEHTYKTHAAAMTCIPCPRHSGTYNGLGTSLEACTCSPGFQGPPGGLCEDIDECAGGDNGGCSQGCVNTPGNHYCTCTIPGYELGEDGLTCHKNRSCVEITQQPGHGSLNCRYTEDTNGYICHIGCEDTYFFVSGLNNYITCGSDSDFLWSHQVMNRTARIPSCTKEFFVDVDLPVKLQYSSNRSCEQQAPILGGHIKDSLRAMVNSFEVCENRCRVHDLVATCVTDQDTDEVTLRVDFKVMIKNPEENAVTPGCEVRCQRQNMRQIIGDAFTVRNAIKTVVEEDPDRLNVDDFADTQLNSQFFQHGRPDLLCVPGRVYTKNRLCVPCDAGYHHPDRTLKTCVPCPIGTYQDEQGQTFCKPCLPGSSTLTQGADHPIMCNARVAVMYNVTTPAPPTDDDDDFGAYSIEDLEEFI